MPPSLYVTIPSFQDSERTRSLFDACFGPDGWERNPSARPDHATLQDLLCRYDVLLIGIKETITADMLAHKQRRTRVLGTLSIGTDHIELEACQAHGVQVVNAPLANVKTVAEHTLASLLFLSKSFWEADTAVRTGKGRGGLTAWPRDLGSLSVGLLGAGNIGYQVAAWLRALGTAVSVWTFRPERHPEFTPLGVRWAPSLTSLFAEHDAVSLHLPLTARSRDLVTATHLNATQTHRFALVNTSRAELIAHNALPDALASGKVFAAALDVLRSDESIDAYPPERTLLTPHTAGVTSDSLARMSEELAQNLVNATTKCWPT